MSLRTDLVCLLGTLLLCIQTCKLTWRASWDSGALPWKPPAVPLPTVSRRPASVTKDVSPAASAGGAPAASESSTSEQPLAAGA